MVDQQPMRYDISGLTIYAVDSLVLLFLMFFFFFSCTSTNNSPLHRSSEYAFSRSCTYVHPSY
jgi:hypothetical protein